MKYCIPAILLDGSRNNSILSIIANVSQGWWNSIAPVNIELPGMCMTATELARRCLYVSKSKYCRYTYTKHHIPIYINLFTLPIPTVDRT